jgi:alpha-glucuronidase
VVSRHTLVVGTSADSPLVRSFGWSADLQSLGPEGFVIRPEVYHGRKITVVAASSDIGVLYGTFHLLRLIATSRFDPSATIAQKPAQPLRLLNHWDNLDSTIERGYAGRSIWKWEELPAKLDDRYAAYARANASIGINGAVLNNVNANPLSLSHEYLVKTAALADLWRPYGIRVYLSANFAAPKTLGGLSTADPLDPRVRAWWKQKADEIYGLIPDFGGLVVKANCEGQPGPADYGRTHADGANTLADAVATHGGVVMWRAFVYDQRVDPDRAKRAYLEFMPLDGRFRDNVLVQVKNGPIDFQPREPFHPLFGAMRRTRVLAELQITQEYLGHSKHLVFLAPMWKEFLDADTFCNGPGSRVCEQIAGIAAVANTGSDHNWCGHDFAQANWYAFGRLAWDPSLTPAHIADEWLSMTFPKTDTTARASLRDMMLGSWETFVGYSMPLGLHHLIAGDHYAPAPWNATEPRPDWTAVFYHHGDAAGIGFDRTSAAGGSGAVEQYFPPARQKFEVLVTCPEELLLWFHHVRWTHPMRSGRTLWEELCSKYAQGAEEARRMEQLWHSLHGKIDPPCYRAVAARLAIQARDAKEWRDHCLNYFHSLNGLPIVLREHADR